MVDRITHFEGDESGTAEYDVRVDGNKHHYLLSIRGTLAYETVLVFPDTTTGSSSNSGRSANSNQGTSYVREFSSGEWQDWNVTTGDAGGQSGTGQTSSGVSRSADGEDYESFCGLALELPGQEVEFRYVGNETVNGVSTGHYFHKYSPGGVGDYVSTDYWLDADGLLRQVRTVWYGPPAPGSPESRLEHFKTYSGWGEPNVITVPGAGSPVPMLTSLQGKLPTQVCTAGLVESYSSSSTAVNNSATLSIAGRRPTSTDASNRCSAVVGFCRLETASLLYNLPLSPTDILNYPDELRLTGTHRFDSRLNLRTSTISRPK